LTIEEIVHKEDPEEKVHYYEAEDEGSSYHKKREVKEERKAQAAKKGTGRVKSPHTKAVLKKAVEKMVKKAQGGGSARSGKSTGSRKTPGGKASGKKSSTKKGAMTISHFKEYIGWYDKQAKAGKFSQGTKKASVAKRSTSKSSRRKLA